MYASVYPFARQIREGAAGRPYREPVVAKMGWLLYNRCARIHEAYGGAYVFCATYVTDYPKVCKDTNRLMVSMNNLVQSHHTLLKAKTGVRTPRLFNEPPHEVKEVLDSLFAN